MAGKFEVVGGCHIWTASVSQSGYPMVCVNCRHVSLRRLMKRAKHGQYVTATCGNRRCVRKDHLRVVSRSGYMKGCEKSAAMIARATVARRKAWNVKLSVEKAREIRARRGESQKALAKEYGVCRQIISYVWNNHLWREPNPLTM